ncbi:MAG: LPS export ABC transporter periplasmic protein LptC [Gammaproteobacteria bacterium]
MTVRSRLTLVLLALLAGGAWWLNDQLQAPDSIQPRPAADGFYMLGAEITAPDAEGLPRYRLVAAEIRQVALGGETLLKDVRVEYNVYSASPWLLTAPDGSVSADQEVLELWGGVDAIGDSGDHGPARLITDRLEVDIETSVARTDDPVQLILGPQELHGVGLVAYLLEERLQLESEVHGRFLP